jgi:serine/threonine protein phosphatase PrpC
MGNDTQPRIELRAAVLTDVGVVRDHNEDSAHIDDGQRFFIVADGMGGHAAGEVASAMAVEVVRDKLNEAGDELSEFAAEPSEEGRKNAVSRLEEAVRAAHQAVYERGVAESDKQGMGTTLDVVLVAGPEAFVAHVGDSRTYLIRDGKAAQITTDHTVAEVLVIEGKLSLEEAQISPLRTILVNAIGVAPDVGVEMAHVQLRKDDRLLLCSDGLHDYFPSDQELADLITSSEPDEALKQMIELAKERGGHDNITGVIIAVDDCEPVGDISGVVTAAATLEMSDGVPAPIERDDTLPVDVEDPPVSKSAAATLAAKVGEGPAAHRRTDPQMDAVDALDDTLDTPLSALTGGNGSKAEPAGDDSAADDDSSDDDSAADDDGDKSDTASR